MHVKQLEIKSIFKYFNQKIDKANIRNMSFKKYIFQLSYLRSKSNIKTLLRQHFLGVGRV